MQPTTPRLTSDPAAQSGYAPIAWAAVAALVLACGFVVVLGYLAVASYFKGLPLTDSWIPFVPALVVMLAFVARRQIRASEGTRTGEVYANAAWWIAVVSGVAFVAYLLAVNFTVQRDAKKVFNGWADSLKDLDAFNPSDPNLLEASWLVLPPGVRPASKKDAARIEQAFGDAVAGFRQTDVVRLCQRNRGQLTLTAQGLKDWSVKADEISCVLTAVVGCPEGDYGLELPMRAAVDDKGVRRWQIQPAGAAGYIKTRTLTRAGWEATALEADGAMFGRRLLIQLNQPNPAPMTYLGFVQPGWTPGRAAEALGRFAASAELLGAVASAACLPVASPLPPDWPNRFTRTVFARPDGSPMAPADAERVWRLWSSGGQITPSGGLLKNNSDVNGVLAVGADTVEYRVPVEMSTGLGGQGSAACKGRLVFRLPSDAAGVVAAIRTAARPGDDKSTQPPADFSIDPRPWRLVRFETDLKPVQVEAPMRASG